MKKLLLALTLSLFVSGAAHAACSQIPLNIKDASSNTVAMSSATSADGNCKTYIDEDTSSQFHSDLTAPIVAGTNRVGYVTDDPCSNASTKLFLPITVTTSTVKVIATGVAAKKIYICQLILNNNAADNVAIFEATTGSTCATSPIAVYGAGTTTGTAGNGFNFSANGGVSIGNGGHMVGQTTVNNNDLCIGTSASTVLSGGITYVNQ